MRLSTEDLALRCIRCGFCLDACPTFRLTGNEADSPRGRIYLMRLLSDGELPVDGQAISHLDACLGCRACETACPSGVEYAAILEDFRAGLKEDGVRPPAQEFARGQMLATLTSPRRFASALRASRLFGGLLGPDDELPAPVARLLGGGNGVRTLLPTVPPQVGIGRLPGRSPAEGPRRFTVGVLAGCAMRVLYGHINEATVRVLQRNGCDVLAPAGAGCCGALHVHAGFLQEGKAKARALLDAFAGTQLDAFVVNSAGCGSTLKEYGRLLADDPVYAERAATFASLVRDVSEYLAEIGFRPPRGTVNASVAYHDACHLAHGQGITAEPRQLLASIPGLTLVDLPESDTCCGSAGTYNLTQPAIAQELLERKVRCIEQTGAQVVAAGNPGCLAWIEQGIRRRKLPVAVRHPIELLDEAYRAEDPL